MNSVVSFGVCFQNGWSIKCLTAFFVVVVVAVAGAVAVAAAVLVVVGVIVVVAVVVVVVVRSKRVDVVFVVLGVSSFLALEGLCNLGLQFKFPFCVLRRAQEASELSNVLPVPNYPRFLEASWLLTSH